MERVESVPGLSRPYLGRGKQPGTGWLVGGLGCQAVGLSVRQGQPGAAAHSWAVRGERETEAVGGRLKAWRAGRQGGDGAERETRREGASGAERKKRVVLGRREMSILHNLIAILIYGPAGSEGENHHCCIG